MALTEVNSLGIKDLEVKTADIAADAVTGAKIADDQIDSEHYVNASIDHAHLANDCVDGDNLADNACDSEHYTDGSIDHVHLAADAVDGDNIADDSINSEHYVAASIDNEHLADNAVGTDEIADLAVGTDQIAADAVTLSKMAGLARGKLIVGDSSGNPSALAAGSNDQVLTMDANGDVGWEAASGGISDVVSDTTPQLGGDLDVNTKNILVGDSSDGSTDDVIKIGAGADLNLYHDGTNSYIVNKTGNLIIYAKHGETGMRILPDGNVELYFDNTKKCETTNIGISVTGSVTPSSGVYIGGAGGGNHLDDYEKGTWTPTFTSSGGGSVSSYGGQTGWYIKVGKMVHAMYRMRANTMNGMSGEYRLSSLPFTSDNGGSGDHLGTHFAFENWAIESDEQCTGIIDDNQTYIRCIKLQHNGSWGNMVPDSSSVNLYGCASYMTD